MRRNAPGRLAALACAGLAAIAVCGALSVGGPPQRPAPAPATPPASVPATSPATFKVATFNVLYENRDLKAVAETIRKSGADVVCLQETNEAAEKSLREQLGKTYPHATFKPGAGASGFGILSRTPLRNVKHLPPKEGWFGTHLCEANLAGRAVQIIDAHLTASTPPAGASVAEIARVFNQREAIRAKELAYILKNTEANLPRLIVGDFNAMPGGTAPQFLRDKGFLDSLASARADHATVTTWRGSLGGINLSARVDYVFHTKDLQSTDCQVLPSVASDHSLVVSTLRWAPAASRPDANSPATSLRIP